MKGRRPIRPGSILLIGLFVLVSGVMAGGILGHVVAPSSVTAAVTDHLYLTIAFNPYTGVDEYFPANFSVPQGVPVVITVTNYDNGSNPVPAAYAKVSGTTDGSEVVTNATLSSVALTSVPTDQVAHTFTLDSASYNVNVPIPKAQGQTPTIVTFTVVFTSPGEFVWHCMAPCDGHAMTTPGYMTGTITVEGQ